MGFALHLILLTAAAHADSLPQHSRADGFHYMQDCARDQHWVRVEASKPLQAMYKVVSQGQGNQWLPVYSCIRDQDAQDKILAANHCAPRFGDVQCSGRIAANISEHTRGTAGDFFIRDFQGKPEVLCRILDQARTTANGGRGGITYYGTDTMKDPNTGEMAKMSALHMDIGTDGNTPSNPAHGDWCNWGLCEQVLGEGHCMRTKFRQKKADIEEALAAAKLQNSQASVANLTKALQALTADCKPGDLSCRDNFKN